MKISEISQSENDVDNCRYNGSKGKASKKTKRVDPWLCMHEDMSSNFQFPHRKPGISKQYS